ncbi:hypothetical protein PO870_09440 [Rhizobium sp. MJ37]|nr:hypothetical protein [Rhizobium sp. MJ37]
MDAFVVDDGELYILFERSFDWQSPHHQTLPMTHPTGHEVVIPARQSSNRRVLA